ncbi:HAD family hydrolase [Paenibacillus sp. NPDC058174]|uniref:HAD family hydrolase n=1 Tax=Paenibacillus sp. NPDC058174 TaxID=3346366 RepID=UPI0036D7E911
MQKTFIWFDLGYTLVYQNRELLYQRFLLEEGINRSLEEIEAAYHLTDKLFMRQYPGALGRGLHTFYPWYIGVLNYTLQVQFDLHTQAARLHELQREEGGQTWRAFPFVRDVFDALKDQGYGIGLISNWDAGCKNVLSANGLIDYFDELIVSAEVELEKPDERIFTLAMERAGIGPEQSVYVGDNYYDDVVGSAKAGMDCYLINRFGRLGVEELQYDRLISSIQELPVLLQQQRGNRIARRTIANLHFEA